jgi:hypothetical protein
MNGCGFSMASHSSSLFSCFSQVCADISAALQLRDPITAKTSFNRPNLTYAVRPKGSGAKGCSGAAVADLRFALASLFPPVLSICLQGIWNASRRSECLAHQIFVIANQQRSIFMKQVE